MKIAMIFSLLFMSLASLANTVEVLNKTQSPIIFKASYEYDGNPEITQKYILTPFTYTFNVPALVDLKLESESGETLCHIKNEKEFKLLRFSYEADGSCLIIFW